MRSIVFFAAFGLSALAATASQAQDGDAEAGAKVFNRCKACHTVEDAKNKVGPTLMGVIGRTAGTVEGYKYSNAMIEAGQGGLVWDEANIAEYVKDPKGFIPGNKMAFAGLKKDEEIANMIAYLKEHPAQ